MAKSSLFFVASLLLLLLLPLSSRATATVEEPTKFLVEPKTALRKEDEKCGYQPIENIKDEYFQNLGLLAVKEYNKENNRNIKFQEVFAGNYFVYIGTSYDLRIRAIDGISRIFLAIVYKAQVGQNVNYILNEFFAITRNQSPLQKPLWNN